MAHQTVLEMNDGSIIAGILIVTEPTIRNANVISPDHSTIKDCILLKSTIVN